MKNIFHMAIPREGTEELKKVQKWHENLVKNNPSIQKESKKKFKLAYNSLVAQNSSGIGFLTDTELRHFLREFNQRTWNHGIQSQPMLFNIMEAYFSYNKNIIYFELYEEEDYLISFFDFIDFITSPKFDEDSIKIEDFIEENLIYNLNIGADINELTFETNDSEKFVIGGISLIRRGSELIVLLLTGQLCDTEEITKGLEMDKKIPIPGKENIKPDPNHKLEAVKLMDNPNHWKTIAACRFNLDDFTLETRYIGSDIGTSYMIKTDDIQGFLQPNGEFLTKDLERAYEKSIQEIENYNPLFEVAKLACFLPFYLNEFEDEMISEERNTLYSQMFSKPIAKRKMKDVPARLRNPSKTLWLLNRKNKFSPDLIRVREDKFHIETSGYWKKLNPDEIGTNKKGKKVTGKTWINKKLSWYEAKTDELVISKKQEAYTGKNAGYIYVLRNPTMEENVFKIGLTRRNVDIRKKELSNTSVPDKFYKMNEWEVRDCVLAEKEIHSILDDYRIDPRREFFKLEFDKIIETVETIIRSINSKNDTT